MSLLNCVFILIINVLMFALQQENLQLEVNISNIQKHDGVILVAIYDSAETFLNEPMQYKVVPIEAEAEIPISVQTVFTGLADGEYAVSVYHDENENWELDRNWMGIPKEMFGFSNNAKAKFSPPKFDECSVNISAIQSDISDSQGSNSLVIRLKNW